MLRSRLFASLAAAALAAAIPGQFVWQPAIDLGQPGPLAYDSQRQRVVQFDSGSLWEWDGTRWDQRLAPNPPAAAGAALAYDSRRGRVVLFGGLSGTETWEWDGLGWQRRTPATTPPPGRLAATSPSFNSMVYDAARQRTVMFGRSAPSQTWLWDGTDWTLAASGNGPAPRVNPAMAYDPIRMRTVLCGGENPVVGDAWEWDGTTWSTITAPPVSELRGSGMTFDSRRQRVLLCAPDQANAYEWDGSAWTTTAAPGTSAGALGVAFDAARGETVLFTSTGISATGPVPARTTWLRAGTTWREVGNGGLGGVNPGQRARHTLTYHAASDRFLLLGRDPRNITLGDWVWDRRTWTPVSGNGPSLRQDHAAVADTTRQRVVVFGGAGSAVFGDTWEWDGTAWANRAPATAPAPRYIHAMAYDSSRARTVLFGGTATGITALGDTWEWDGTTWTQRTPATSPAARTGHSMAFDPTRQRVVLFGGSTQLGDTWEWDGTTWRSITTSSPVPPFAQIEFYPPLGEVVAHGMTSTGATASELWSYDGSRWARVQASPAAPARFAHAMTYDPIQRSLVLDGGVIGTSTQTDTGYLTTAPLASIAAYGAACAGSAGLPRLVGYGRPQVTGSFFALELDTAASSAPAAFAFALNQANTTLPGGCTLHLDPTTLTLVATQATSATGTARALLVIPRMPSLLGLPFHTQAAVLDPIRPAGPTLSQGLTVRIGV
jgi:hypothetical protein